MKKSVWVLSVISALTALPSVASAQDQIWLRDRKFTEGIGYRVGDFELHPGVAAEFGYDSNFFRRAPEELPVGALRLRLTPSLSLSTLSAQRREAGGPPPSVEFNANVAATYNEFFPVSGPDYGQALMKDQRNVSGNLDLNLKILPGRVWSGSLEAGVSRSILASNEGVTGASFNRILPHAGGELVWTPGGGMFDWRLGYMFSGTFFESSQFSQLSNIQNQIHTRGRWRFLPRTALMYDGRFGFITYTNPTDKTSSHPVRARIGVNGLVTSSFSVLAMAGWGGSFYSPGASATVAEDFDSLIGQLELKWFITPNPSNDPGAATLALSTLTVGFLRDFYDSYIGTYFERDRGYVNLTYFFGGRFLLVAEGGAGPVIYPQIQSLTLPAFTNVRVDASLFGEYRFKDSFGINATFRYNQNIGDTSVLVAGASSPDYLRWLEIEAYLGARWFM